MGGHPRSCHLVFTEDAQLDTTEDVPNGKVSGRREIVAFVSAALEGVVTVHHGHMPEIEITGSNTARGVWSMEDHLEYPGEPPHFVIRGRGHYHEEYEKQEDGVWRIKTLRLTRLRLDREGTPAASFLAARQ